MSDMKPTGYKINLDGKEYGLRFTLNAIDDIQEHFDIPISEIATVFDDEKTQIRNVRYILTLMINEDIDCVADETGVQGKHVTERYVGRHIGADNIDTAMSSIFKAIGDGSPEADPNA